MKVKSVLNLSASTRVTIWIPKKREDGTDLIFDWNIDYTRKKANYFGKDFAEIDCAYLLPREVLNQKVDYISTLSDKLLIVTKGED